MDRQQRRELIEEMKTDLREYITSISDYQIEQAVTIVKTQLRLLEQDNELDKKRIVKKFENDLEILTEKFQNTVEEVRRDFTEDIRRLQQGRARDKTDSDNILAKQQKEIT